MQGSCGLFHTSYAGEAGLLQTRFQKLRFGLFLPLYCLAPLFVDAYDLSVLIMIHVAIVGAVSLNLLTGFCGQISLGHGAFMGVGAYAAAVATNSGLPFFLALPLGGFAAAAVGMFFGIPSLRLKGIYLAIATLAAQIIIEYVLLHWDSVTGGSNGLLVASPEILGLAFDDEPMHFYLTFGVAVIAVLAVANIVRTRMGRAFVSVRDFYLSAEIVGVNLFTTKLTAFGVSSFLAGVAGGLWAHYVMYITPEMFGIGLSISYLAMIIIGGLGSVQGAVFGAIFITLLPEVLTAVTQALSTTMPGLSESVMAMKEGIFGLVLVLFLIFEPEGLAYRWRLFKAYWKLYPFAH